jgi:starch synthase (maltosyl-transferring)
MEEKESAMSADEKRQRVVITGVSPEIEGGRFPIKRVLGESVQVEADIFTDGHDSIMAVLCYRHEEAEGWSETALEPLVNDRWRGSFEVSELGHYLYVLVAWVDHFKSWQRDMAKKIEAGQENGIDYLIGAQWVEETAQRVGESEGQRLREGAALLKETGPDKQAQRRRVALDPALAELMVRHSDRRFATRYEKELRVAVDPLLARFGAWYEVFPRSLGTEPGRHGTFKDCEAHLARVSEMGFDVLYFPPIHPIGRSFRKGKNNSIVCEPDDVGSPWAIGAAEGGHKAVLPELGTIEDFRRLVQRARDRGLEVALDIAYQCAPDHPYVKGHPQWFKSRPDGSIQYAENPPKKYQDIYPFDFETEDAEGLWRELKSVFEFWIEQGVRIFRVDNPHTKPFAFWEWCLSELKAKRRDLVFLSEAFTRPKVMYRLAKLGYTQSYNYFPWRNTKQELTEYFTELTRTEVRQYFRPNLWPNTPDILPQYLQNGGRPAFVARLILAATLGASYGIYGPAFELCENQPRTPGAEEYLNSEKYEIKRWDLDAPGNLTGLISMVNRIRKENPALQANENLEFHPVDNEEMIAYSKATADMRNLILTVVNLDPHHTHSGWVSLDLERLGIEPGQSYQVHDLLTGARYLWHGSRNYAQLNPVVLPAHIFRVRRKIRSEQDFDYFM